MENLNELDTVISAIVNDIISKTSNVGKACGASSGQVHGECAANNTCGDRQSNGKSGLLIQQGHEDFCVVNEDGSCIDNAGNDHADVGTKRSDSMNNLFDNLENLNVAENEVGDNNFFNTVSEIKCVESGEDLHSDPSSVTLTNVSSSASNQYLPSKTDNQSGQERFLPKFTPLNDTSDLLPSPPKRSFNYTKQLQSLDKEELIEAVESLKEQLIKYEGHRDTSDKESFSSDDVHHLCDIVEHQRHTILQLHRDRENLQNVVIKRDQETAEIVERMQAELSHLKKQNTVAVENKIRKGQVISNGMARQLVKAKYDADKMLVDSLQKQTKINELRLLILKQQQQIQELEKESDELRYWLESLYSDEVIDAERDETSTPSKILNSKRRSPSNFNHLYNCDVFEETTATGDSRNPLLLTVKTFSTTGDRRRRMSSESQRSEKSYSSGVPSPCNQSQTSDRETSEDMDAYLQDCNLAIEKSMAEF